MSGGQFNRVLPSLCVAGGAARYRLLLLSLGSCPLGTRQRHGDRRDHGAPELGPAPCMGTKTRGASLEDPNQLVALASPGWQVWVLLALFSTEEGTVAVSSFLFFAEGVGLIDQGRTSGNNKYKQGQGEA